MIAGLRSAVAEFSKGTGQKDDLTAVIIKRKASAPSTAKSLAVEYALSDAD